MRLILKLLGGIALGIVLGLFAPDWVTRILITIKALFGELLFFTIPLLILFFISSGIAALPNNSGRLLGRSLGLAYFSTLVAGTLAFLVASVVVPIFAGGPDSWTEAAGSALLPYVTVTVPPLFNVMTALMLAFVMGLGMAATGSQGLRDLSDQGRDIIQWLLIKAIIPMLPVYIAGVFAEMASAGTVFTTLRTFGVVLLLAVIMHWVWILVLFTLAGFKTGKSPIALIKNMLPAYFTALGTMSSAATIPVSLQSSKRNGVREDVANFTVPLFATTHLSGSTITIVSCAIAVISMRSGLDIPPLSVMIPFILTLVVETTSFHPQQSFRSSLTHRFYASPQMHVTERFTRVSDDVILYEFTVTDPQNYSQPWRGEMPMNRTSDPLYEYACHEGNYAMPGILAGARRAEADGVPYAPTYSF